MKLICSILLVLLLVGCSNKDASVGIIGGADGPTQIIISSQKEETQMAVQTISAEEAKSIMDSGEAYVLLDVREQDEYDQGHIPGAFLMPYTRVQSLAAEQLPDQDALILIYCRSGRRSKLAAAALNAAGYTNVLDFGGIIDWPYEVTVVNSEK